MMTWGDLDKLMCECLDLQTFHHGPHMIAQILLGPEEHRIYKHAILSNPVMMPSFQNLALSGQLPPFMSYPVKAMRCPGVAVKIKPKIKGIYFIDEVGYWPSPPPKP